MMKRIGDKRGSHVGMILSFVIFLVFLVFLYTTLEPKIKVQRDKQFLVEQIKNEILLQVSDELYTATVVPAADIEYPACIQIDGLPGLRDKSAKVKNIETGEIIPSEINGDAINVFLRRDDPFRIYYSNTKFKSDAFTGDHLDCFLDQNNYEIKLVRNETQVFGKRIVDTIEETDHEKAREMFGVPADSDFKIGAKVYYFQGSEGDSVEEDLELNWDDPQVNANVYSDKINVQYVTWGNADIKTGQIKISVW